MSCAAVDASPRKVEQVAGVTVKTGPSGFFESRQRERTADAARRSKYDAPTHVQRTGVARSRT